MKTYYVYVLVDPRDNKPFYVGKGTGDRAFQHAKFKDGNNNQYKNRKIKNIINQNYEVIVNFLHEDILDETLAYQLETLAIEKIGIKNLTNIIEDRNPPSRLGWKPSIETLQKRSSNLKGIPRTDEWRNNLSKSKQGSKNGMYGKKIPCTEQKQISIIRTKNLPNYENYKLAITLMNSGVSADTVSVQLGIGRGVCFKLKNRKHLIFKAFPELSQFKTC